MQQVNFDELVERTLAQDRRFARESYYFVREAIDFAQKRVARENRGNKGALTRHVTGKVLLEGIRQFALKEYGPMTVTVFAEWGINHCGDIGELVFNMVENGMLLKTEQDNQKDFRPGYDFTEAFRKPFWPESKLRASGKTVVKQ